MPLTLPQVVELLGYAGVVMANANDGRMNPMMVYATATRDAVNASAITRANAAAIVAARAAPTTDFQAAKRLFDLMNANNGASAAALLANAHLVMVGLGASWEHATNAAEVTTTALRTTVWPLLTAGERTALGRFVRSRAAAGSMTALMAIAAVAPETNVNNLRALAAICIAAYTARPGETDARCFAGITAGAFAQLRALYASNAPNTAFAGFAAWGPGDHGGGAANVTGHFRKHVCGLVAPGGQALEYKNEFAEWWEVLRIALPLAEVEARLAPGQDVNAVRGYFGGPNNVLMTGYIDNFISSGFLAQNPDVVTYLRTNYEAAYEAYAIQKSAHFDEVLVQSNGLLVFISGYKDIRGSDLFIIGRLDAGALGISSAYFTKERDAKMKGARSNKVWDLT